MRWMTVLVPLLAICSGASAQTERDLQRRFCAGMILEFVMPDETRADCISATHAIEVDFSDKWAEAIGQALHYALWTHDIDQDPTTLPRVAAELHGSKKAGIILICRHPRETCNEHFARQHRIIQEYNLPVTVWDCDLNDGSLAACQRIDE